jgi:hypothetical protein
VGRHPGAARQAAAIAAARDRVRENATPGEPPRRGRPAAHEHHDRRQHVVRRGEIALVHAELAPAVAHHHGAVPRQAAPVDAHETERPKARQQLRRIARRRVEREIELIMRPRQQPA